MNGQSLLGAWNITCFNYQQIVANTSNPLKVMLLEVDIVFLQNSY